MAKGLTDSEINRWPLVVYENRELPQAGPLGRSSVPECWQRASTRHTAKLWKCEDIQ